MDYHIGGVYMNGRKPLEAEDLLEQIFYYMNQLVHEKDLKKTLRLLTDMGKTLVNAERASFWYWDTDKKQYWTLAASDSEQLVVPEGTGIVGVSITNCETIVINEPYNDSRFHSQIDKETGYVTKSILCMPVTNEAGKVIGAYQAINKLDENGESKFDDRDVKRMALAAVYSGKALESHLLYQVAHVDSLTQLRNRRGVYEYYNLEVLPTLDYSPVSIVMCDIDYFKRVNDTYGHNAGDEVLRMVAKVLSANVSEGEVFRWGGEEFVVLLPGDTENQAKAFAENLRKEIEESIFSFEEEKIRITMSFGVSECNAENTLEENMEVADARLYEAKSTGRNRVV